MGNKLSNNLKINDPFIKRLIIYIIIAVLIRVFIFNITSVKGSSMMPTLEDGDKILTQKLSLYFSSPKRGDIVVIHAPDKKYYNYIKRVIGLPGDRIEIIGGKLFVNDLLQIEDYISEDSTLPYTIENSWIVPENQIFVMGDNRGHSKDSRIFGTVNMKDIIGISFFRIYPIFKIGSLK
ncbi:MAG: signal peptidase I [Tissierellia bacterium]|nr:signal peptidase I [Tissierellia bacterium]